MDIEKLKSFLQEAHQNTYANKKAKKVASTRLNSEDYHFEKDNLTYHDTYFGSRDFMGEEVIYQNNKPMWGMNYYGFVTDDSINEKDVYRFLRDALMISVEDTIPVRGPKDFSKDSWIYRNNPEGGMNRFSGVEEISNSGIVVYKAHYHGGLIV